MIIDLHTHSHYSSDGKLTIPELLDYYSEGDIVAITDHETIGGWDEFKIEAKKRGVQPILGVEWFSYKCHILSYFINDIPQAFFDFMANRRETEKKCMHTVYEKMKAKYPQLLSYEEILTFGSHPENIIGLPALGMAIAKIIGIDLSKAEDIVRKEKRRLPIGERPTPFYPQEIISKINSWSGEPVLAHPYRKSDGQKGHHSVNDVEMKIRDLYSLGIKGLEVYSWKSTMTEYKHLMSICTEMNLTPIIGSDFHSCDKGRYQRDLNDFDTILFRRLKKWL